MNINKEEIIRAGIFGEVVGDALGVPVEFTTKEERKADPVTNMREYGTHGQPKGTWSDDSSMLLATLDSIILNRGINPGDIMEKFRLWLSQGDYTPYGKVFDAGITCTSAIRRYISGVAPAECGGRGEMDNGNGSLMRILPVSLYVGLNADFRDETVFIAAVKNVHDVSSLTHAHPRSLIGCVLYTSICHELIYRKDTSVLQAVQHAVDKTFGYYSEAADTDPGHNAGLKQELKADAYGRLRDLNAFKSLPDTAIRGSGYIVHCLEASVWCLLNSDSYAECVLKAVNLGEDTDTTAAVAGGLAGLTYGCDSIPDKWLKAIASKDLIERSCSDLAAMLK